MNETVKLTLYIAGKTPAAVRAIANLKRICSNLEPGHVFEIDVIDIVEQPEFAERENILAIPMVVRKLPPPIRRVIGDLSDKEQVLVGLQLQPLEVSDDGW